MKQKWFYYLTAFTAGMAVMITEISMSRLLAPYFGNSLFVWTNVIGLVLLALSFGYYLGGKWADEGRGEHFYFLCTASTGLWIFLIPFIAPTLFTMIFSGLEGLNNIVTFGSFFSILVLLVPPMIFLGMITPYTVKLVTRDMKHIGRDAGRVSMLSTFGSLLGTFLPGFLLIPTIGTMKTFIFMGVFLMLLGSIGLKRWFFAMLALLLSVFSLLTPPVYAVPNMVASAESPYGYVFIREQEDGRKDLYIDQTFGIQSIYDPNGIENNRYYTYFTLLPAMIDDPQSVLILGHAGGIFTRYFNAYYPELEITGVEINPKVTELAWDHFKLSELNVDIVHGDARAFLANTEEKYDLILVDAYHNASVPTHMATNEFFALTREHMTDKGLVAMNVASTESQFNEVLKRTFLNNFEFAEKVQTPNSFNSMVVGRAVNDFNFRNLTSQLGEQAKYYEENAEQLNSSTNEFFTDDKSARVDVLTEQMLLDLLSHY